MKRPLFWLILAAAILFAALCVCLWIFPAVSSSEYYVQIDNSRIEAGKPRGGVIDFSGGMPYFYTLPAYGEDGKEKEIKFGAHQELREGAYLRLTVSPVRGVLEWVEVQYDELPAVVQGHMQTPDDSAEE